MSGVHKYPTISFRISPRERDEIEAKIKASGMQKKDYFVRSCIYNKVCVVGKREVIYQLVEELHLMQEREAKIATLCESAISDACAEIDGYLAKRYRVPFTKTPQVINKFAKDISVYNLVSRTGIDESDREKTFLNRYNAAIKFLLDVAKGIISIGVEEKGGSSEAANGFKMKSSGRVFSRDSMRGW